MIAKLTVLLLVCSILLAPVAASAAAKQTRPAAVLDRRKLAEQVRAEFLHAWRGYQQYAWGHDDLRPLTKTYHDWYQQPLYMTPVDALDTMILMGLHDEAEKTKTLIVNKLSFDQDIYVQNFEITIRHLGGLLSIY